MRVKVREATRWSPEGRVQDSSNRWRAASLPLQLVLSPEARTAETARLRSGWPAEPGRYLVATAATSVARTSAASGRGEAQLGVLEDGLQHGYPVYSLPPTCGVPASGCPPPTLTSAADFGISSEPSVNVTSRLSPARRWILWNPRRLRTGAPSSGPPPT